MQTIDLAPTILSSSVGRFRRTCREKPLYQTILDDTPVREYALLGQHGVHVNIMDGRYVYMRCPLPDKENELYNYILEPSSYPGAIGGRR